MSATLIFCSLFVTLIVTAYLYVKNKYLYWKRRGVPYIEPTFPFGNFVDAFLQKKSFAYELETIYNESTEPFVGIYTLVKPALLVRDPKIIKDMLIKEFQSFSHRGWHANVDVDPMSDNILLQKGDKWKRVRTQLSPAFSSGKLKAMFQTIFDSGKSLDKYIGTFADTDKSVEMREVFARFATNVIVSVAFGIDIDCIENPDCEFRKYGQRFFEPNVKNMLRMNIAMSAPTLARLLRLRFADEEVGDFMIDAVRQNLEYREKDNVSRKDFFQLLMQLRNTGKIQEDDDWTAKATSDEKSFTLEEMAAQAFLFFIGGFESSSSTMSFCMYELAKHPEIQEKAYNEIIDVLQKHDGQFTYDSVAEMKYFDSCLDESLRLHPPFPAANRTCTKDYKIPDTNVVIEKGTSVMFSATGLQYDPKYYDEPSKFMPERYAESKAANRGFLEMPNLTFGEGPRNCLGLRMGKLQSKIAIILLLHKFKFELDDVHKNTELEINPISNVLAPINGLNLKVLRR